MQPIRPDRLADAIVEHIQQLIAEGGLLPGERLLAERELAAKLEVSRPTLRDALAKLISLGLVTTDAQGAAHVSEAVGKSIRDPLALLIDNQDGTFHYLEFRKMIEGEAAAFAAQRASDPDRELIKQHFERMGAAHRKNDVEAHVQADADFHIAIYEASHNLVIMHIMRSLETLLRSNVFLNRKSLFAFRGRNRLLDEHEAIFSAIMNRDPEGARKASQCHVDNTLKTLHEIYDAEKRLQVSIRRLERNDLVVPQKPKTKRQKAS
jgi:GntR family transcriptional repressor for pyruvate dehydrogenase complex